MIDFNLLKNNLSKQKVLPILNTSDLSQDIEIVKKLISLNINTIEITLRNSDSLDIANCDFDSFKHFFNYLLNHGIYIAPSQYEAGFISLAHTREMLDITVRQIDAALQDVFAYV